MKKYLFLCIFALLASCGEGPVDSKQTAEEEQTPKCEMSPEGRWAVYPQYLIGTCGFLSPFWVWVDDSGSLKLEESVNCQTTEEFTIEGRCQNATYFRCTNEEENLTAELRFYLKPSEEYEVRIQWEGNVNIEISTLDTNEPLCDSVYKTQVIYNPQEE